MTPPRLYQQSVEGFYNIAHRGASYDYPENTMIAFEKAYEMGADLIELDVMITRDNVPIIFHDRRIDKRTKGKGVVGRLSYEYIKSLDAGSWFGKEFAGTPIPTLDEVLSWASGKIAVNIEIKREAIAASPDNGIVKQVIDLVRKYEMEEYVLISTFSYEALEQINRIAPEIPTGLIYNQGLSRGRDALQLVNRYEVDAFKCHWRQLSNRWRRLLRDHEVPLFIFTVNKEKRMRNLIRRDINGIITDRPDLLNRVAMEELNESS